MHTQVLSQPVSVALIDLFTLIAAQVGVCFTVTEALCYCGVKEVA
jgi:hypothetical protein